MLLLGPFQILSCFSLIPTLWSQITTNTSEPLSTSATNITESDNSDYKTSNSKEIPNERPFDIELFSLNKYRRDGMIDFSDNWDDGRKRYMDYRDRNRYDDDYQFRERNRANGKSYPVRIQGCNHYSRDVSRDDEVIRSGILQGWLGTAQTGKPDDKRLDMSPFYVTTATAKTSPSYRNRDKNHGEYNNNYEKSNAPDRSKYFNNYRVKGSASKDFYNFQANYPDDRSTNSWDPQQKNNRVVYYEYNLDDSRRPDSTYYGEDNFRMTYNHPCESDYEENIRISPKNYEKDRYRTQTFNFAPQSKLSTSFNQEPSERPYLGYYSDNYYQPRNSDRNDGRTQEYGYNPLLNGPLNGIQYPGISSTFIPQTPIAQDHRNDRQDRNDFKNIPLRDHRFQFQTK